MVVISIIIPGVVTVYASTMLLPNVQLGKDFRRDSGNVFLSTFAIDTAKASAVGDEQIRGRWEMKR